MIVDLNDKAFDNAKNGDVFIIEEKNGKKYACPISKDEFFLNYEKRVTDMELQVEELTKLCNKLNKEVTNKLIKIAELVGGSKNE